MNSDPDLDQLSEDELRALYEQRRVEADRLWHAISARVGRPKIGVQPYAELELALCEAADPATTIAFKQLGDDLTLQLLVDGAPAPAETAVARAAEAMVLDGWAEGDVAGGVQSPV